jgi:hypothetical protein
MFLSGGLSDVAATRNLDAMNRLGPAVGLELFPLAARCKRGR